MSHNSFQHAMGTVEFASYRPEDVEEAMASAEALARQRVAAVLGVPSGQRTFDNTVLALAEAADEMKFIRATVSHLAQVLAGPWQPVEEAATDAEARFSNELRYHKGLYRSLIEVRDRPGYLSSLSAPRQKYLNELVLTYERDGIALDEAKQQELKDIAAQLSAAGVAFTNNLIGATDAAGLAVSERAELNGLSDEFAQRCRADAEERGRAGYWVVFNYPNYRYLMANCTVRRTRQEFYRLSVGLAAEANLPVAQQFVTLRRRLAELLGYRDYSDYVLELRMARNGATAAGFVAELTTLYGPAAQAEHEELVEFARRLEGDPALELDAADIGVDVYYSAQLRAEQVGLVEEALRDYLTLPQVRDVLFSTVYDLYGLTVKPAHAAKWHDDVEIFELWDGGRHLSTVWCDWYARKGKMAGAWADAFYVAPRRGEGAERPMLGCVVCNFPAPDQSGWSRLSIRDVETVWHEFGHFLHFTANMTELRQHGSLACRWDFIEAPSQIMENWVWQREVLNRMAVHYRTGASLSPEVMGKLVASRQFRAATAAIRQLSLASEDLALHRGYGGTSPEELVAFHRACRQQYLPVPVAPGDAYLAQFQHIFSGEYAAAYYSYKWAEAIEADLFSVFMPDKFLSREVGTRYREEVLARGAEVEPDVLVQGFLGRASTPEAMLERDGVKTST